MNSTTYLRQTLTTSAAETNKKLLKIQEKSNKISTQMLGSRGNTGQRRALSKCLVNFRNFIVSLITFLFISKL